MADQDDIVAILHRYEQAVLDRDADAVFADYADEPVAYDLAPPLEIRGSKVPRARWSVGHGILAACRVMAWHVPQRRPHRAAQASR